MLELYHSEGKIKEGGRGKKQSIWVRISAHNQWVEINVNPTQTWIHSGNMYSPALLKQMVSVAVNNYNEVWAAFVVKQAEAYC